MRYLLAIAFLCTLLLPATARAGLISVEVTITRDISGGWDYTVLCEEEKKLYSDEELAEYLLEVSNPLSGITLWIESEETVPLEQIIKILEMAKANSQEIELREIRLRAR